MIPSCLETWLSWGRLFFWNATDIVRYPSSPSDPAPTLCRHRRPAAAALLFGLPQPGQVFIALFTMAQVASRGPICPPPSAVEKKGRKERKRLELSASRGYSPPTHRPLSPTSCKYISRSVCWMFLVKAVQTYISISIQKKVLSLSLFFVFCLSRLFRIV